MPRDDALVTVVCLTFNHAPHVAESLDSFLRQKTDFPFTVLVHDDASTDGTGDIIRQYAAAHPDVIKPILQTENQHSQGVKILARVFSELRTQYAALCEGDDYWSDPSKLQRQVDWMRANPDGSLCGHATLMVTPEGSPVRELRVRDDGDGDLTVEQVLVNHDLLHTSSLVFPSVLVKDLPPYYYMAPVGDRPIKMYLATQGRVHYLDRVMSHYRYGVTGSWTARMRDAAMALRHASLTVEYLEEFDRETAFRFTDTVRELSAPFRKRLLIAEMESALREGRYDDVRDPRFAQVAGQRVRLAARVAPLTPVFARRAIVRAIRTMPSLESLFRPVGRSLWRGRLEGTQDE